MVKVRLQCPSILTSDVRNHFPALDAPSEAVGDKIVGRPSARANYRNAACGGFQNRNAETLGSVRRYISISRLIQHRHFAEREGLAEIADAADNPLLRIDRDQLHRPLKQSLRVVQWIYAFKDQPALGEFPDYFRERPKQQIHALVGGHRTDAKEDKFILTNSHITPYFWAKLRHWMKRFDVDAMGDDVYPLLWKACAVKPFRGPL